jgi:predicted membrane-bound spermidine synthase
MFNYIFLFFTGFISISFEILAMRLFTPFWGSGPVQTSIVIGFVLLFLSLGNITADKKNNPQKIIKRNLIILCLLMGALFNHWAIFQFNKIFSGLPNFFYENLFIANIIFIAPISFLFGQIYSTYIKWHPSIPFGMAVGTSTAGSCLGALVTSLTLTYFIGPSSLTLINLLLLSSIFIVMFKDKTIALIGLAVLVSLLNVFYLNPSITDIETGVANYEIYKGEGFKGLIINGDKFASIIAGENTAGLYNEYLHDHILNSKKTLDVLILGAGGFTLSLKNKQHHYTYVDIDPKLKEVIQENFNPGIHGDYIFSDARAFMLNSKKKYHLIVQDVFTFGENTPPQYLLTKEHFKRIQESMTVDGFFGINFFHKGLVYQNMDGQVVMNTLLAVFKGCYFIPMDGGRALQVKLPLRQTLAICSNTIRSTKVSTDENY